MALRTLTLELEQEEFNRLLQTAKRRGYSSADDYLRALVVHDAGMNEEFPLVTDPNELEDMTDEEIATSFKRGLIQALRGEGLTEEQFWVALKDAP